MEDINRMEVILEYKYVQIVVDLFQKINVLRDLLLKIVLMLMLMMI